MRHADPLKEVERPIDGRGLGRLSVGAEGRDQVISLGRLACLKQQLQDSFARRGQALADLGAARLSLFEGHPKTGPAQAVSAPVGMSASLAHGHQLSAGAMVRKT